MHRNPRKNLLVPIATVTFIALAAFLLTRLASAPQPKPTTPPPASPDHASALLPAPGPADVSATGTSEETPPTASELPQLHPRGSLSSLENPSLQIPILAGRASLEWITRAILTERKRPPASAVRSEEILNHFPLRPAGLTAVSHGVTLSTESISCPWQPSATLLLVSFRGANNTAREVTATFKADTSNVHSYRLLGFSPVTGLPPGTIPSSLPAKTITSLVIEIEPSTATGDLGAIEWSVNGQNAAPITVIRHGDTEPSNDARFAALVCTYAQWLTRESSGMIDTDLLAALAREIAAANLPSDRMDFLNLIDRSLNL